MTIQQIEDAEYHYDDFKVYPYEEENWHSHFARVIAETVKRIKGK